MAGIALRKTLVCYIKAETILKDVHLSSFFFQTVSRRTFIPKDAFATVTK